MRKIRIPRKLRNWPHRWAWTIGADAGVSHRADDPVRVMSQDVAYVLEWGGPQRKAIVSPDKGARSLRALRATQSREVVGRHGQRQQLVDFVQPLHHHLADRADELAPAEALLDALSLALAAFSLVLHTWKQDLRQHLHVCADDWVVCAKTGPDTPDKAIAEQPSFSRSIEHHPRQISWGRRG